MSPPRTLAWHFVARLVPLSLALSMAFAGIQWGLAYRHRTRDVERSFNLVAWGHLPSLTRSLWTFDMAQARLQMEGLLKLPHLSRIRVEVTTGERWEVGAPAPDLHPPRRRHVLVHEGIELATLEVEASLGDIQAQLRKQALNSLLVSMLVSGALSLALMLLFRRLVARRVAHLADHARDLDPAALAIAPALVLEGPQDELAALGRAFETLRGRLLEHEAQRRHAEHEIRALNQVLEEARARAESASQAKSSFLRRTSHELRTPLNQVVLYSDLISEELKESHPETLRDLAQIREAAEGLTALLTDILDLVDLETSPCECRRVLLEPPSLARILGDMALPWAQAGENVLEVDLEAMPVDRVGDPERLAHALSKLLHNACRFTRQGRVRLGWDAGHQALVVEDTGPGIPPERLEQIHEIFRQGDEGLTRAYGGLGLGLSICQHQARLMGGHLSVESSLGQGSRFRLHLGPQDLED